MLLHTILSLKRPLYLQKQGDKEMFEITYSDSEIFEDYQNAGKAHKGGTYDFTFENRIQNECRGINAPDRKRKAVGQERQDSMKVDERFILRRVGRYTAYFDWP